MVVALLTAASAFVSPCAPSGSRCTVAMQGRPPIDQERRSPGMAGDFFDGPSSEFRRPYGEGYGPSGMTGGRDGPPGEEFRGPRDTVWDRTNRFANDGFGFAGLLPPSGGSLGSSNFYDRDGFARRDRTGDDSFNRPYRGDFGGNGGFGGGFGGGGNFGPRGQSERYDRGFSGERDRYRNSYYGERNGYGPRSGPLTFDEDRRYGGGFGGGLRGNFLPYGARSGGDSVIEVIVSAVSIALIYGVLASPTKGQLIKDFMPMLLAPKVGYFFIVCGSLLALAGAVDLGSGPSIPGELRTSGGYKFSRNPLSGGALLACVGVGLLSTTLEQMFTRELFSLSLYLLLWFKTQREEDFLEDRHGPEFWRWASKTPRFFPSPTDFFERLAWGHIR